jgi:hypothetical protein
MRTRLLFIALLICLCGCDKKNTDIAEQEKLSPTFFDVFIKTVDYYSAEVSWSPSSIKDNSTLYYSVFLNNELKAESLEGTSHTFDNLKENTKYDVKIVVESIYETKKEFISSFTTKTCPAPNKISLQSKDIGEESFSLIWESTEDNLKFDVYLDDNIIANNISEKEYTFENLKGLVEYTVKIIAKNTYNKTSEASILVTTRDYKAPEAFEIAFLKLMPTSAKIEWESAPDCTYSVFLDGEKLVNDFHYSIYTFMNLKPKTKYVAKVVLKDKHKKTIEQTIEINTPDYDAPADFTLKVSDIKQKSARVSWVTLGDETKRIIYSVYLNGELRLDDISNSFLLENLVAGESYTVKVIAKNEEGKSIEKSINFTSLENPTLSDFSFTVENIRLNTAVLRFTECIASDGQQVIYTIYHPAGSSAGTFQTPTSLTLTNLRANTEYTYKITAFSLESIMSLDKEITFITN